MNAASSVESLITTGKSALEIDKAVKLDDSNAMAGLSELVHQNKIDAIRKNNQLVNKLDALVRETPVVSTIMCIVLSILAAAVFFTS